MSAHEGQRAPLREMRHDSSGASHTDPGGGAVLRRLLPTLFAGGADRQPGSIGETVSSASPTSTRDLLPSERRFLAAMQRLGYGRFESLRIQRGKLVLEPPPPAVRSVKFGAPTPNIPDEPSGECELKQQAAQFFGFIRGVEAGEIRVLEVRGGLPFCMDVADQLESLGKD